MPLNPQTRQILDEPNWRGFEVTLDVFPDVFAFGITTDFRTRLFPGSQRLIELADRIEILQVETVCWCGARATHNARTVGGEMVVEGEQKVVGDIGRRQAVGYEVLCRTHHRERRAQLAK